MTTGLIFGGAILTLVLILWYLTAEGVKTRLRVGLALWLLLSAVCALSIYPPKQTIRLGLDLKGGTSFLIELQGSPTPYALQQAVEVIRKRVDRFGVAEPIIQPTGDNRVIVQIPGLSEKDKTSARMQLEKVAKLEFRMVHPDNAAELDKIARGAAVPIGYELKQITEQRRGKQVNESVLIKRRVEMSGKMVARAFHFIGPTGESGVSLEFKPDGKEVFGKLTEANVGHRLAIVLDGEVKSAPNIRQPIYGGSAEITGNFTPQEAVDLASVLENPLDTPVKIMEERGVDPSLGSDSIRSGLVAGAIGSVAVVLFTVFYYRFIGLIAVAALLVNLTILFGLLAQFHFTLTLPGIAGIILTIGMAVDANVLIYERIREEMASGKSITASIQGGFDKAFSSILDANVTTIITSLILFWQGSGPVQGFAITLTLGILGTLFGALIVTRNLIEWKDATIGFQKITMCQFVKNTNFDFLKLRFAAIAISGVLIVAGMSAFYVKRNQILGVDFTGGEALTVTFEKKEDVASMRNALDGAGFSDFTLQMQKGSGAQKESVFVRTRFGEGEKALDVLKQKFPGSGFEKISLDKVGAVVGDELKGQSFLALVLGMLGILVYVTWRFEFSFAIGAIIALLHDVLITVGVFALLGHEISLTVVGAILTIAGYSINDTIVVFDRLRECLRNPSGRESLKDLMNRSLNLTLSRTILTSLTTLLSVIALYLFGGAVIHDFAFALLIGIVAGTYSSIYIACPIVLWWTGGRDDWLRRQISDSEKRKEALQTV